MSKLSTGARKALPKKEFAGPDRSFPIPDKTHAKQALRERKFAANPAAIVAKVKRKFPGIGKSLLSSGVKK